MPEEIHCLVCGDSTVQEILDPVYRSNCTDPIVQEILDPVHRSNCRDAIVQEITGPVYSTRNSRHNIEISLYKRFHCI